MEGSVPVALPNRIPKNGGWSVNDSYDLLGRMLRGKITNSGTSVGFLSGKCFLSDTRLQWILEGLNFKQMLRSYPNHQWSLCLPFIEVCKCLFSHPPNVDFRNLWMNWSAGGLYPLLP